VNEENPDYLVPVGDSIMGVNDVRCTASEVPDLLGKSGHAVVELRVLHFSSR